MSPSGTDRWKALDFGPPPADGDESGDPVLLDHLDGGRVALVTLNRPHADNAITTEMGARLFWTEGWIDETGNAAHIGAIYLASFMPLSKEEVDLRSRGGVEQETQ